MKRTDLAMSLFASAKKVGVDTMIMGAYDNCRLQNAYVINAILQCIVYVKYLLLFFKYDFIFYILIYYPNESVLVDGMSTR